MTDTLEARINAAFKEPGEYLVIFGLVDGTGNSVVSLIRIKKNGAVWYFPKPTLYDMYIGWKQIVGNTIEQRVIDVHLWPTKDSELMSKFDRKPDAVFEVYP